MQPYELVFNIFLNNMRNTELSFEWGSESRTYSAKCNFSFTANNIAIKTIAAQDVSLKSLLLINVLAVIFLGNDRALRKLKI